MDQRGFRSLELRSNRERLVGSAPGRLQERAILALSEIAARLLRRDRGGFAEAKYDQAPIEAAWMSLQATLESWDASSLNELIDSEDARAPVTGPAVTLHVVASNTPLLAWTSIARALLVESASIVRLPQDAPDVAAWTQRFLDSLAEVDEPLLGLIYIDTWPSSDTATTQAALAVADCALVYGSDKTVEAVRALATGATRVIGFGSRISLGLVLDGADLEEAAQCAALDIALFDQQGCLSPQSVYVQGPRSDHDRFVKCLAKSLEDCSRLFPARSALQASRIREATDIARFKPDGAVMQDPKLLWTVTSTSSLDIDSLSIPGFVSIRPLPSFPALSNSLARSPLLGKLQGASIAARDNTRFSAAASWARQIGVCYICKPGHLQRPPFSWREDNKPVLACLL